MDRIEPYIGMPIILGDGGTQGSDGRNCRQKMPQAQAVSLKTQQNEEAASAFMREPEGIPQDQHCPPVLPETPAPPQENGQACLNDSNCNGGGQPSVPQQTMMVGMAYVPWQRWQQPYDYEEGFRAGTIFPDLNYPFSGHRGGKKR